MVWYGMVWYGMVWYGMVWYGMVWYGMVWYGMVWYGMVWYGMVWYGMVWLCWCRVANVVKISVVWRVVLSRLVQFGLVWKRVLLVLALVLVAVEVEVWHMVLFSTLDSGIGIHDCCGIDLDMAILNKIVTLHNFIVSVLIFASYTT